MEELYLIFFIVTEIVTDMDNRAMCMHTPVRLHKLNTRAAAVPSTADPMLYTVMGKLSRDPVLVHIN